jgi:hypothetical protein
MLLELHSTRRKFHSTETAVLKVLSDCDILQALDTGDAAVLVQLHLSAAFDTIDTRLYFGISRCLIVLEDQFFSGSNRILEIVLIMIDNA